MLSHKLIRGTFDPDAMALFRRMTPQPPLQNKRAISKAIAAMKRKGIWSRVVLLYFFAAHAQQAALLNWRSNAYDLTLQGLGASISFSPNDYLEVVSSGNASHLSSGFASGPSPLFQPASAHMSAMTKLSRSIAAFEIYVDPAASASISIGQNDGGLSNLFGENIQLSDTPTRYKRHLVTTRTGSLLQGFNQGGLFAQNAGATGTTDNGTDVYFLRTGSSGAQGTLGRMASLGQGLTAQQAADFSTIVNDYMTAIGAPV